MVSEHPTFFRFKDSTEVNSGERQKHAVQQCFEPLHFGQNDDRAMIQLTIYVKYDS